MNKSLNAVSTAVVEIAVMCLIVALLLIVLSGCNLGGQILVTYVYQNSSGQEEAEQADGQLNPADEEGEPAATLSGKGTNVSNIFIGGEGDFGGLIKVPLHAPGLSLSVAPPAKTEPTTQPDGE